MPGHPATDHPKTDEVCGLLDQGLTNVEIARRLHLERQTVGRIRRALGIANVPEQPLTLEQKWATFTRPTDGGHLQWTGETAKPNGTPVMRYGERSYTAARIAFRIKHGRDPEGYARAECGLPHCVAPDHVDDTATRVRDRSALRIVLGMAPPAGHCRRGHDQTGNRRLLGDGRAYCLACQQEDKRRHRADGQATA